MTPFEFLVLALATWRLAYMISVEDGPYHVFERIRGKYPLGGLTTCIYCLSVWIAPLLYVMWITYFQPVVTIIGISGAAMMLYRQTGAGLVK